MKVKPFKQIFDPFYLKGPGQLKPQKVFKFTWEYCGLCDCMFVRCPMCGNNCCNAGFGRVKKKNLLPITKKDKKSQYRECPVCNLAYQFQNLACKTKNVPPFPKNRKKLRLKERNGLKNWFK